MPDDTARLRELLAGWSQSDFVRAASSDDGEELLNLLVGTLGNAADRIEALEAGLRPHIKDFRWRANQCRTNLDAYCEKSAAVWDFAADALEGKQ